MTKYNKRKGFSAIEMLIVIAVIAVLVSVVIPVIGNQTIKSKAATNAANLRAIETAVSLKMAESPEKFDSFFETGKELAETSDGILGRLYDLIFGEGEGEARRIKYNVLIGDDKSPIQIPGSDLVISGLTGAKGLEAPGRNGSPDLVIAEDTPMASYITEEGVVVFYGNYTKADFADVAEDGYYDGMVTGGGGGDSGNDGFLGDIQDAIDEAVCRKEAGSGLIVKGEGKHKPGADCVCPYCGGDAHWRADKTIDRTLAGNLITYNTSTKYHKCTCGFVFNATCKFEGDVHDCVYLDCEGNTCVDLDPNNRRDKADHKCYLCGERYESWCSDTKGGGTNQNPLPNHKCDLSECNATMSKCGDKGYTPIDATQHECNICKVKSNHSYSNGNACACGYSKPTCSYSKNGVRCTNTEIVEAVGDKGYCATHNMKDCNARVPALNIDFINDTYDCDGKYRGTIEDCSNAANHVKCGVCKTHAVENNGYCSEHQEKTCNEKVLKEGGGTKNCGTKYRTTCDNATYHHTTHTYTNTGDAAQHHCLCGEAQNHSYDSNGKCTCGATKTKCKFTGGCNIFEVDSEGYCATHQNLDRCAKHGKSGNKLTDCVLMSRDPNATCTAQHYKNETCGCTKSTSILAAYYCSTCEHFHRKTCTETIIVPE